MKQDTKEQLLNQIRIIKRKIIFLNILQGEAEINYEYVYVNMWIDRIYKYQLELIELNHKLRLM